MALDLVIGEQVSLPPAGKKSLILDADGEPFLLTEDGTREALGGGAVSVEAPLSGDGTVGDPLTLAAGDVAMSPFHARMITLQASLATLTGRRYQALGVYPSGVVIASRTHNQTAMNGGGIAPSGAGVVAMTNNFVQTPKTVPWFVGYRARVTGTFTGLNFALMATHDGTTDFVRFGYEGGLSNSFWAIDVGHSGASTSANSAIALDSTVPHDHAVHFNGSTAIAYYIDGVLAATISNLTNFPTTPQSLAILQGVTVAVVTEAYYAFNETV